MAICCSTRQFTLVEVASARRIWPQAGMQHRDHGSSAKFVRVSVRPPPAAGAPLTVDAVSGSEDRPPRGACTTGPSSSASVHLAGIYRVPTRHLRPELLAPKART